MAAAALLGGIGAAQAAPDCTAPSALTTIEVALSRAADNVAEGKPLNILAIGSSSTLGIGASSREASYPSRLEADLKALYPHNDIHVVNRGVGGEDAPEELARLGHEIEDHPSDLVIWQVGTNAVLRRDDLTADERMIGKGVRLLQDNHVDVVLMDLQFAPRVVARPGYAEMEQDIADTAREMRVGLFRRFAIMQAWDGAHQFADGEMIGRDGLHMTDASYGCLAQALAAALDRNWQSHRLLTMPHAPAATVAGLRTRQKAAGSAP
ncbi:MAG TPA: SGNH/GDSL hydrolase family protein [Stellaceae bacterium]|nr:SGNH/GDSL hydrolase family protein [Stellaceae bacterium]